MAKYYKAFIFILLLTVFWGLSVASVESQNDIVLVKVDEDEGPITTPSEIVNFSEDEVVQINKSEEVKKPFLLSRVIRPQHYKLEILPLLFSLPDNISFPYSNVSKFSAPGKVWIRVSVAEATQNITLHAHKDILIESQTVYVKNIENGQKVSVDSISRDNDTDFLVLHLEKPIGTSNNGSSSQVEIYAIFIEFTTRIADDRLNGLYLDYYINPETKEKRYLSTSLFAPNHARKAFPCFDEPEFKATFSIKIGRKTDTGYYSISNMPIASTNPIENLNGWVWDEFEETVPLPTYLVALITVDFGFRTIWDGELELRLHAPKYLIEKVASFNRNVSVERNTTTPKPHNPYLLQDPLHVIADSLKSWKGTKLGGFPLSKLDIIALPHFYYNAMENLGAITFKYPVILNIENVTTTSELLRLSFVAGHEVMHTWFGTLLTPKSWTYVWLKESFSDLFARVYLSEKVNAVYNHADFVNNELQRAMRYDGSHETHPLENHVKSASAVGEIYTDIPYRKGASIMNMAQIFLTESVFKKGLESLFDEKKYSNIDQNDLFEHLENAQRELKILERQGLPPNVTVADILNTWTKQSGYPVVRYQKAGQKLILKQEKFRNRILEEFKKNESLLASNELVEERSEEEITSGLWWIPIPSFDKPTSQLLAKRQYKIHWMPPTENTVEIPLNGFSSLITNVEGYFRLLYGKKELHSILKGLIHQSLQEKYGAYGLVGPHSGSLEAIERSQLLDDYFTFAFSNYEEVSISLLFHVLSVVMPREGDAVVWNTFFQNMQKPYKLFQRTDKFPLLQEYLTQLIQPLHSFLDSQKHTIYITPCFHATVLSKRMHFTEFSARVLSWLCVVDESSCGAVARKAVSDFVQTKDPSGILADEQETIFCAAVKYAISEQSLDSLWSFFENMYFQEYVPVQRDRYLKALSCTKNTTYLEKLLSWTTNATLDFHDVDRSTLLKYVIANPAGRTIIFDFLNANFDMLYKSNSVANPVTESVKAVVDYVNTKDRLEELESFLTSHKDAMEKSKKSMEKQVKKAKLNILWMDKFAQQIESSMKLHLSGFDQRNTFCKEESVPDFEEYVNKITDWLM